MTTAGRATTTLSCERRWPAETGWLRSGTVAGGGGGRGGTAWARGRTGGSGCERVAGGGGTGGRTATGCDEDEVEAGRGNTGGGGLCRGSGSGGGTGGRLATGA
jgi:hypothetical protein